MTVSLLLFYRRKKKSKKKKDKSEDGKKKKKKDEKKPKKEKAKKDKKDKKEETKEENDDENDSSASSNEEDNDVELVDEPTIEATDGKVHVPTGNTATETKATETKATETRATETKATETTSTVNNVNESATAAETKATDTKTVKAESKAPAPNRDADGNLWATDISAAGQESRKRAELNSMKKVNIEVEAILEAARRDNLESSPSTLLKIFMASKAVRTLEEISSEVKRLQIAHHLDETKVIKMVLDVMINVSDVKKVPDEFKKHSLFLKTLTQRRTEDFMQCLEEFVGVIQPRLLQRIGMILHALHESDVLTETAIITWYDLPAENSWLVNKQVAALVRKHAKVYVDHLRFTYSTAKQFCHVLL